MSVLQKAKEEKKRSGTAAERLGEFGGGDSMYKTRRVCVQCNYWQKYTYSCPT